MKHEDKFLEQKLLVSTEKKKAEVGIMISDKSKAKIDLVKRDRKGNYVMIEGSIDNEEISALNK